MKRLFLLAMAALTLNTTLLMAQAQVTVDQEGIKKKLAKSDADIQNPKKNEKSATWIDRAKVYNEAASAATAGLYKGMDEKTAGMMFGKSKNSDQKIGDDTFKKMEFPNFVAYAKDGKIQMWTSKLKIVDAPLKTVSEAFDKAYEIDKNPKVKEGLEALSNVYKQDAENYFMLRNYKQAAGLFRKAYDAERHPSINLVDTLSLYNAGYLYTLADDYKNGKENLEESIKCGYEGKDGDAYYLLFFNYNGLKDTVNTKRVLLDGLGKYPNNMNILTSLLSVYANGGGDPKEIVPIVEKKIQENPKNPDLWSGLGRIYDKLGEPDKSIDAFAKSAALLPDDFGANFNLGLLYIKKGDAENKAMNDKQFLSQKEYNDALAVVNAVYRKSIEPLEKALALNPKESSTVELLKNVCFRLRDEAGIMDKYNKYKEMLDGMQQAAPAAPAAAPAQ